MTSNSFEPSPKLQQKRLENESEKTRLRHDLLKHLFSNHTFAFILVLIVCGSGLIVAARWQKLDEIKAFWQVIIPLISTYIGFAIGGAIRERS